MSTYNLAQHNKALMKEIFQGVGQGDPRLFYSHLAHDATLTKSGAPYQNDYCLLYRLRDDLIVEIKEYEDSMLCERLLGPYPLDRA